MKLLTQFVLCGVLVFSTLVDAQRPVTATIDILAYNDVYELVQDKVNGLEIGGPSRVVPLVASMRAKNPNSLVLFAGDTMSPSLWSSQFKGMQMTHAHNALGTDFACLGNHEFDFGIDAFLNLTAATNFPWLNANCYETKTRALLRSTIPRAVKTLFDSKYGTIKIGFFGVMYDMKDSSKGLYWTDPIEVAKREVEILRTQHKVDMVIALTHQDFADDNRMSKEVKGIDVIYAGHDHASMLQTSFGTPYLKADFDFRSVWQSHIKYFRADPTKKISATFRMQHQAIPIVKELPSDPALDTIIADYSVKVGKLFGVVVGTLCEPLDLTQNTVRTQDAPIGHVFTDAQLKLYADRNVDVALTNGGGIRTDTVYPVGNVTLGTIMSWSPFGNTIMVTETDGASMKTFLKDQLVGSCGDNVVQQNGMYLHPAGIKYVFKCTGVGKGDLTLVEWFNHPTRKGHVLDGEVFRLVLNDFLYNTVFSLIPNVRTKLIVKEAEAERLDTALDNYIRSLPNASLCEKGEVRSFVSF